MKKIDMVDIPYEPPISFVCEPPKFDIDNMVVDAVQKVGIYVNKDQLACIINGDRQRYEAAYKKGYEAALAKCKENFTIIANLAKEGAEG